MAIARGAGTEIIRTACFEDIDSTLQYLCKGEAHHIYTILSINVFCETIQTAGNVFKCILVGYDAKGGTSAQQILVFQWPLVLNQTFVWESKFSFCGSEPVNFTGPMDDTSKQDAIADQASDPAVLQYLKCNTSEAGDNCEVIITFIDQNNE